MEDLINRYLELYEDMATSANPDKMHIFGNTEKWAFKKAVETNPKMAQCWLDKLEAMSWHNYLSKTEAEEIVAKIVNQDGSRGAHWGYETFKQVVTSLGGKMSEEPYYNCYAMWVTANMLYSDHAKSVAEDMGATSPTQIQNEKMALSMYKKSLEKLKDIDRPKFIREYFGL